MFEIAQPVAGQLNYPAKVDGSGLVGFICTQGTSNASFDVQRKPGAVHVEEPASLVIGKNYQGINPVIPDQNHPPDPLTDPLAKFAILSAAGWCIHPLPNVLTGPGPGADNVVAVWAQYQSGARLIATQPYKAIAADAVDCTSAGSNVICPPPGVQIVGKGTSAGKVHGLAPATWKVETQGFSGSAASFNGTWLLRLDQILGGHTVWRNLGHGDGVPLVELRCESPVPLVWRLSFRSKDAPSPTYERAADAWKPLGPNVLALRTHPGLDPKSLPTSVTLTAG